MFGRTGFFFALLLLGVVLHSNTVQAFSNMSKVKHVVMFTLQDDVSEEKVQGMVWFVSAGRLLSWLLNSRCVCVKLIQRFWFPNFGLLFVVVRFD